LLPLLRSRVQGDVLACTFLHPEHEYSLTELARRIGASVRSVHHEVDRLVATGLLLDRRVGNLRLVRASLDTVLAGPLTDLLALTFGPLPVLSDLLRGVSGVDAAYLYGSWAARYLGETGDPPRDIDVLVVGTTDMDILDDVARAAEERLGRPVSISRLAPATWNSRDEAGDDDPFLVSIRDRPLVRLSGIGGPS
jgi:predicted nucleotidyltransferase